MSCLNCGDADGAPVRFASPCPFAVRADSLQHTIPEGATVTSTLPGRCDRNHTAVRRRNNALTPQGGVLLASRGRSDSFWACAPWKRCLDVPARAECASPYRVTVRHLPLPVSPGCCRTCPPVL